MLYAVAVVTVVLIYAAGLASGWLFRRMAEIFDNDPHQP